MFKKWSETGSLTSETAEKSIHSGLKTYSEVGTKIDER
jgi:hypothetical protein